MTVPAWKARLGRQLSQDAPMAQLAASPDRPLSSVGTVGCRYCGHAEGTAGEATHSGVTAMAAI
jgi:hypothetical protein